jgi:hypothetical protein
MSWKHTRHRHLHELPDPPNPLGDVVGATLVDYAYRDERPLHYGGWVERWRLTSDLDALLLSDAEFVSGDSRRAVRAALELRYPSACPDASRVLIWRDNKADLLVHDLPVADTLVLRYERNPNWTKQTAHYCSKYQRLWVKNPIVILEEACSRHGDLLVTQELESELRNYSEFDGSDLVIGKRNSYYGVIRYAPKKAHARRKSRDTIKAKAAQRIELSTYTNKVLDALAAAFNDLRITLLDSGASHAIVPPIHRWYGGDTSNGGSLLEKLFGLVTIHQALRGKNAYRHVPAFQAALRVYRERPGELDEQELFVYGTATVQWFKAEAARPVPRPTKAMIAEDLRKRTCAGCGHVVQPGNETELCRSPTRFDMPEGSRLCSDCYARKDDELRAREEEARAVGAAATTSEDDR